MTVLRGKLLTTKGTKIFSQRTQRNLNREIQLTQGTLSSQSNLCLSAFICGLLISVQICAICENYSSPQKTITMSSPKKESCIKQLFKDKNNCYSLREIATALLLAATIASWIGQQFFSKQVPEFIFYSFATLGEFHQNGSQGHCRFHR